MNYETRKLEEKRDTLLRNMQALTQGRFDGEARATFDRMNRDCEMLDSEINNARREHRAVQPMREQPGQSIERDTDTRSANVEREKRAFERYVRFGETRDITTGSSGINGAALVPQAFDNVLTDALKYFGPVAQLVRQKVTNNNGAPIKIAVSNDTTNGLTVLGETTAVTETDPSAFAGTVLATDTVTSGVVKVSVQELEDSAFDLDSWIRDRFSERYGRGIESMVTLGNSSNVAGLIAATQTVAAVGNGTAAGGTSSVATDINSVGYTDLINLFSALDPAYAARGTWMFNSTTRANLLGLRNTLGNPLLIANPTTGAFDNLLGQPIALNQSMASIGANHASVFFGSLKDFYVLRTDGTPVFLRLNERYMDQLEVGFILYSRIGGLVTDAGTHPGFSLVHPAS